MTDNTIESLSVALTGDASQLARDVEQAMQDTIATMEVSAEEMAAVQRKVFDQLIKEIKEAVSDPLFEQWRLQVEMFDKTTEEAARHVAENYDVAMQDVVDSVESAYATINNLVEEHVAVTRAAALSGGIVLTEEEEESIRKKIKSMYELGDAINSSTGELKELNEEIELYRGKTVESVKANRLVNESVEVARSGYEKLGQSIPIEELDTLINRLQKVYETGKRLGTPLGEIRENMLDIAREAIPKQVSGFGELGGALKSIAVKLGLVSAAYVMFRKVGAFIKEAVLKAQDAVRETISLTLATRSYQRAVGDLAPTVAETNRQVEYLSDTYNLNRSSVRELVTDSMRLTIQLSLTKEQLESLQESAVVFGQMFDRDVTQVMQQFTNYLLTGHSQGLRELGIRLDETTLRVEAIKRGYIDYGDVLDDVTARLIAIRIFEERAADAKDDLILAQATLTGQLAEANVELDKQQELVGKLLLPAWQSLKLFFTKILVTAVQLGTIAIIGLIYRVNKAVANLAALAKVAAVLRDEGMTGIVERGGVGRTFDAAYYEALSKADEVSRKAIQGIIESGQRLGEEGGEGFDKAGSAAERFADTIHAAMDSAALSINEITRKFEQDLAKARVKLNEQLTKIDEDFRRRRLAAHIDTEKDLRDIDQQANERKLSASHDFYNTEERERADHQLAMARMEADYLMSLEDAVHERDARQVLSLRRKFTQDKKRANEDYSIAKKRRREDFTLELAEIERQRIIRRNKRIAQFEEEIAHLAEQEALKLKLARDSFNARIAALHTQYNDMLRLEAEKLAASLNLNADHLSALANMLDQAYGSSGFVVAYIQGISEWLSRQVLVLPTVTGGYDVQGIQGAAVSTRPTYDVQGIQGRQRAGTMFASSPQLVMVGEGPERIDFSRLSTPGGGPRGGGSGGGDGVVEVKIALDDGLVGKIADETMQQVANVFVSIESGGPRTAGRR